MPQVGERRSGATETVEWNGSRWTPVEHNASAEGGYHPSLADSSSPWLARVKGFLSGASEAATPAKVGTAAALAAGIPSLGMSLPVAAGIAGGGTAALDAMRSFFKTSNAPQGPGDVATDIGTSMLPATAAGVIGKGVGAASGLLKADPSKVGGVVGAGLGGYEGYQHGGVPGAVMGAATGAFGGSKLAQTPLGRLFGATAAEEAPAAAEVAGGFAPGASGRAPQKWGAMNEPIPDTSHFSKPGYEPQAVDPAAVSARLKADQYMPNIGADNHETAPSMINFPVGQPAAAQPFGSGGPMRVQQPMGDEAYRASLDALTKQNIDKYMPSVSGYQPHSDPPPMRPDFSRVKPVAGSEMLDQILSEQGANANPVLKNIQARNQGTAKFDPITEETVPNGDMGRSVDLGAAKNAAMDSREGIPASLAALNDASPEALPFYKRQPDAVGAAYKAAKADRAADPTSVNPIAEKQLGVALNRSADDAGLPTRGGKNLDKFLQDWLVPQLKNLPNY